MGFLSTVSAQSQYEAVHAVRPRLNSRVINTEPYFRTEHFPVLLRHQPIQSRSFVMFILL